MTETASRKKLNAQDLELLHKIDPNVVIDDDKVATVNIKSCAPPTPVAI